MTSLHRLLCTLLLTAAGLAQATVPVVQRETLNATLWVQRSAEYQYSTEQIYRHATDQLKRALRPGTASLEQEQLGKYAKLPPAVVLDIDETLLDNSPYQGWTINQGLPYSEANFRAWVRLKAAKDIPGAVAFTKAAEKLGIKVIYVTNRGCDKVVPGTVCQEKADTMENMAAHGFARAMDPSAYLLLGEQPEWVSDKTSRRALLAKSYRLIMLIGDDLKDILPGDTVNALRRDSNPKAYQQYLARFGHRWFILPNPVYGSWDRALPTEMEKRYAALSSAPINAPAPESTPGIKLATWNIEWLRATDISAGDKLYCATTEGKANIGYCTGPLRTPEDYRALARYADVLNADVIALQEVNGVAAAARVFDPSRYDFYFTELDWVQKTGFAVRKDRGLSVIRHADVKELGEFEAPRLRWGADITVKTATGGSLRLLGVHLKSGCFDKPLSDTTANRYGGVPCPVLKAQVPVLQKWIDQRRAEGVHFAVLGDFNRRLAKEGGAAKDALGQPLNLWPAIVGAPTPQGELMLVSQGTPYQGCSSKDRYDAYIDHIVVNKGLAARIVPGTYQRVRYEDADVEKFKLSDHCPMAVKVQLL